MRRYVWRDLIHNPRRSLASLVGVTLGVGLFSGVLFFMDGSGATMTQRAIAPLALDIQRVLTATPGGGLHLTEQVSASLALSVGQQATITLVVDNASAGTANEVTVNDLPPPPLTYMNGSTVTNGTPVPDVGGESPLSHGLAGFGLNLGRLGPGATVTISYSVRTEQAVDIGTLPLGGTVSSREQAVPISANASPILTLDELQQEVSKIPGVAAVDGLGFLDLPPGSLAMGVTSIDRPVRVFAFDQNYQVHYPSIQIVAGGFRPASALLSAEASRSLAAQPGAVIELRMPGRRTPLSLPVSGVVDLTHAQPLFSSRKSSKLEQFLYVPDVVVVSPETFREEIIPAFEHAQGSVGNVVKSFPLLELDVLVDRAQLRANPGTALAQTKQIARAIDRIAPGQGYLIDNISNTLAVARDDAAVGRRMFIFLALPGVLMAAFLAAYAGSIMAAAERREHATLRVRGAHRGHLQRIALYKAFAFASAGSVLGIALGLVSAAAMFGWTSFFDAASWHMVISGLIAIGAGAAITALALYIPALRSVGREVSLERREMQVAQVPVWRRMGLDLALLAAAGIAELVAIRTGALDPPSGSVYAGVAIPLPSRLLLAPVLAWIGGLLLCVRLLVLLASHLPRSSPLRFGSIVGGILSRSLRRRTWSLATGTIGLGLIVSFGVSLSIFAATYGAAKTADSRFGLGSDLRVTFGATSDASSHLASAASALTVPGVYAATPVVFRLEDSVLIGPNNQRNENLAAIDPSTFARVAPLPDSLFGDRSGAETTAALAADPQGLLVDAETAADLQVGAGDTVQVILALGTKQQVEQTFHVLGLFSRFPGFPEGANLVINLDRYWEATGDQHVDFFLAGATDQSDAGLARTIVALRSAADANGPIHVASTSTALAKDQSSLTAVNVNGLVGLDALFMALMSAAAIAMFIFGLMLQRRREFVTLRAEGLLMKELHVLVLAEAGVMAICGLATGLVVGSGIGFLIVHILRGQFILDPVVTYPFGHLAVLSGLLLAAAGASGLAATEILRRLTPTEVLREE